MITIFVVGGAGYIGSHTCKALKENGYFPVVYDNLKNGHQWAAPKGKPLVIGDLLDSAMLDFAFSTYQPQVVLHFASLINVRDSLQHLEAYYQNNVVGSMALLQAMHKHRVPLLVFSSSAAVYGLPQENPISETHPCHPINVYGTTKWITEQMIHDYEKAYHFRSIIFRYFNAAGADPKGKLGEAHHLETHLIPLALRVVLGKQEQLNVFGTNHLTPDGTAIRDYIHVTDLATAHVKAVQWLLSGKESKTLNLGTGYGYSLQEVLSMVERVSKKPVKKMETPKNLEEPPILVANASQAMNFLQWRPIHSDLETIVSTAYQWHKKER